jgi:predicted small lipoprotein YifL
MILSHMTSQPGWRSVRTLTTHLAVLAIVLVLAGCGSTPPTPAPEAAKKPEPAVPQDVQDAATALLGSDTQVLLYGDLAKNGQKQFLAANVVPNTPKSTVAGTVVTRAVIAENVDGKWTELLRADEYLKNEKGYLALTPLQAVTGWKLQYENSEDKGVSLYFTPIQKGTTEKTLPIAVRWNPAQKRYQSMDTSYQHFLNEAPSIGSPRSALR